MSRKPYPKYRPSGVEWLGEIPADWETQRIKYVSSVNDETLEEGTDPDSDLLYVDIGSVDQNAGILKKESMRFESAPSWARRRVRHGDVIVSTVRTYLRAIAPVVNPEPNLIVSTGFAVVRPKDCLDNAFAAYALRAPYFVDGVVARSVGVSYPAINASDLVALPIALPPLTVQRAIAAFLDRETARIDALIEKKQRQIELLQEKRAALISHAVTKGLDRNAEIIVTRHTVLSARRRQSIDLPRPSQLHGGI
jgi:type I restriction enzyme S subunit